jgi:Leucine-rich repeat (LRR) protein
MINYLILRGSKIIFMITAEIIISKLEKQIGKKFKNCKFNIDGWVFDDVLRYQVNEREEIIKLKINNADLKEIPEIIFQIESLKELSLEENSLSRLQESVTDLKNLRYLNLAYNDFEKFPIEISAIKKLETLNISNNKIKELPCEIEHQ